MLFQQLKMMVCRFSSKTAQAEAVLPFKNGGAFSIPRATLSKYYEENRVNDQKQTKLFSGLVPEVEDFKSTIYHDPIIRMSFQSAIDHIPEGGVLHAAKPDDIF